MKIYAYASSYIDESHGNACVGIWSNSHGKNFVNNVFRLIAIGAWGSRNCNRCKWWLFLWISLAITPQLRANQMHRNDGFSFWFHLPVAHNAPGHRCQFGRHSLQFAMCKFQVVSIGKWRHTVNLCSNNSRCSLTSKLWIPLDLTVSRVEIRIARIYESLISVWLKTVFRYGFCWKWENIGLIDCGSLFVNWKSNDRLVYFFN